MVSKYFFSVCRRSTVALKSLMLTTCCVREQYLFRPPKISHCPQQKSSEEEVGKPANKSGKGFNQISLCYFRVDQHIGRRRCVQEVEVLFLEGELHLARGTRLVCWNFWEAGGSGRSQMGGMPALSGATGIALRMIRASLMLLLN